MAFLSDLILDNGLSYLNVNGNRLDICSQEPTTYAEATTTYTLGNKTGITIGTPEDRSPSGRKCVVSAITDGNTTGAGGVVCWAITDTANSDLLAWAPLESPYIVSSGITFTLDSIDIGFPDAL